LQSINNQTLGQKCNNVIMTARGSFGLELVSSRVASRPVALVVSLMLLRKRGVTTVADRAT
jgi:hypothetical protein